MKFNSANEMYELVREGFDLYNINTGNYVFVYSDKGSIAVYCFDLEYAKELSSKAVELNEYWGAFLGRGGYIYENGSELEWCKENYCLDGWRLTNDLDKKWNPTCVNEVNT